MTILSSNISSVDMDALPKILPGQSITEVSSKLQIEEIRMLIPKLVHLVNDPDTHMVALHWLSSIITVNRMCVIRDPTLHEPLKKLKPFGDVSLTSLSMVAKLFKLKGRLDTITERMTKRKSGTLEPYSTYMDEDSTDKIDKFLLMSQVKPIESDDDDMDLSKIV